MEINLRQRIPTEEFDYPILMEALGAYAQPRRVVSALLRRGDIVRVKKGLYVFGPGLAVRPYSRERLANLISGPSYVSHESALAYHGMIPELVAAVTSATLGRRCRFSTPAGLFLYRPVPARVYPIGVEQVELSDGRSVLMAGREKALADMVAERRDTNLRSKIHMRRYLRDDLRIDPGIRSSLDREQMKMIAHAYDMRRVSALREILEEQ